MPNTDPVRCSHCGRFIAYEDFQNGKAETHHEPDTHFGPETCEHYHLECKEGWKREVQRDCAKS